MYRFERKVSVKNAADVPAAVKFAAEVTSYLNKHHSINLTFGVELFGAPRIHWYYDLNSLDESAKLNAVLLQDREYSEMLAKARELWVEGSSRDAIVSLIA